MKGDSLKKIALIILSFFAIGLFFGCTSDAPKDTTKDTNAGLVDMNSTGTSYTLSDVAPHNIASDCWTAINGNVYNITPFIGSHPGGPIIATICGIDGSILYNLRPNTKNTPHPKQADAELVKYYVGPLAN